MNPILSRDIKLIAAFAFHRGSLVAECIKSSLDFQRIVSHSGSIVIFAFVYVQTFVFIERVKLVEVLLKKLIILHTILLHFIHHPSVLFFKR